MSEIKKCPICGGTIHNKVAGKYICSQCGNAISESDVIIERDNETSGADWSYTSFENEPKEEPVQSYKAEREEPVKENPRKEKQKKEKVKKERKKKEPRQKVYSAGKARSFDLKDLDYTLLWPVLCAGVAGICFTLILILMCVYKFRFLVLWLPFLGLSAYLMFALLLWPVFDKAGEKPWKALVPVYNGYVLYEISGYNGWIFFITLIPTFGQLVGVFTGLMASVSLAAKFGKPPKWGIIYLFLLFVAGWVIIDVTNMTYNSSAGHQKNMSPFQNL